MENFANWEPTDDELLAASRSVDGHSGKADELDRVANFNARARELRRRYRRFTRMFFASVCVLSLFLVYFFIRATAATVHVPENTEITFLNLGQIFADYMDEAAFGRILSWLVVLYAIGFFTGSWLMHHAVPLGQTLSAFDDILRQLRLPDSSQGAILNALSIATHTLMMAPPTRFVTVTAKQWQLHSRMLMATDLGALERAYVDRKLGEDDLRTEIVAATYRLLMDRWSMAAPGEMASVVTRPTSIARRALAIAGVIAATGPLVAIWNDGISSLAK